MDETWIDRQEAEEKAQYTKPFDPVTFPRRHWVDNQTVRYKVYSSEKEFAIVEAETASHAILKSKIARPHKVERYMQSYELGVENEQLKSDIDTYIRPILDTLSEGSGMISSKLLNSLNEAAEELREEQGGSAAASAPRAGFSLKDNQDDDSLPVAARLPESKAPTAKSPAPPASQEHESSEPANSLGISPESAAQGDSVPADEDTAIAPPSLKSLIGDEDDGAPILE